MGLFGGGNSSQQSILNTSTSNVVNDDRIGVADSATAIMATDGGTLVQNITQHNTTQLVNEPGLVALSVGVGNAVNALVEGVADGQSMAAYVADGSNKTAVDLFGISAGIVDEALYAVQRASEDASRTALDLFNRSAGVVNDALSTNQRVTQDALAMGQSSVAESLRFGRDALDFAEVTQGELADLFDTFGNRLADENDDNRAYSQSLVSDVLRQARTSDERNIETFLSTAKWIVAFVVIAVVVPKVMTK